jgi:hypothetical protein
VSVVSQQEGMELRRRNRHVTSLIATEREMVATQTKLDRIAHRRPADDLDLDAVAESHLQQPTTDFRIAADGNDAAFATDAELIEAAGLGAPGMITGGISAGFFHDFHILPY